MTHSPFNLAHFLRGSFRHGIHPQDNKHFTASRKIERLPFPPQVVLPLSQHAGKPSVSLVRKGQEVARGEPIARADGFVSVPLHASVSGVVKDICPVPSMKGSMVESIVLDNVYAGDPQEGLSLGTDVDVEAMAPRRDFVSAVQDTGLVGLGARGTFPTHVKLAVPEGHRVSTISD